ncbi:acetyl-CoA synthetase-like protein [Mycena maculata]|uniref:Acetyl-CoA synthetase-like protein n=1 Tax=Mycena maculata TaxID=230809 RepID=A0AAD7IHY8_9AGAR|nr:acetyl-CoA synthetase-like protein [Mycena maculata]
MLPRPTLQGVNSPTFHAAPFDHNLSIPELYKYHALNSPTHPVFMYSDVDAGNTKFVTYSEAWRCICQAVTIVSRHLGPIPSNTLSYIYLLIGIMSLGLTAFPMSPRNNAEATADLLKKSGAMQLFTNTEGPIHTLTKETTALLHEDGVELDILPILKYEALTQEPETIDGEMISIPQVKDENVVLILHSSGTTAFPKPIKITKRGLINLSNIPCYGELDLANKRVAAHTNPIFHAMGSATYIWPLSSGAIFAVYSPTPIIPTPANFLASWIADECDIVFCVPVFIEAWAQDPRNIPKLKALDSIVFSGASVNKSIGDMLAESGVVMHPFWGSTEVGPATMFIPRDPPPAGQWEYFKLSNHIARQLMFQPTDICFPHALNTTHDGKPAFDVGDLLERHPSDPSRWRVYGRQDDQIMLSTGENDKHINSVIMFGRHHLHTGVLIEPAREYIIEAGNQEQLVKLRDLIWPTIERANSGAPAYARIKKKMIITASPSKPLEYTPKGTPRRHAALRVYSSEIDALYNAEEVPLADRQFPDRA